MAEILDSNDLGSAGNGKAREVLFGHDKKNKLVLTGFALLVAAAIVISQLVR